MAKREAEKKLAARERDRQEDLARKRLRGVEERIEDGTSALHPGSLESLRRARAKKKSEKKKRSGFPGVRQVVSGGLPGLGKRR